MINLCGRQGGGDTCMYVFTLVSGKVAWVQVFNAFTPDSTHMHP